MNLTACTLKAFVIVTYENLRVSVTCSTRGASEKVMKRGLIRLLVSGFTILLLLQMGYAQEKALIDPGSIAPFVPTPWHVVDRMLEIAGVTKDDIVYDLGSGDGRILLRAAKRFGARGVGVEINKDLVEEAKSAIRAAGVEDLVEMRQGDIFKVPLEQASVVTLYLVTAANRQLQPKLESELQHGARVVTYKFSIPDWNPVNTVTIDASGLAQTVYLYELGRQN